MEDMIFDKTLKNTTFVEFNPFIRYTDWDKIATMAENYFLKFINEKDYGENVISTRFVFLVEKEIDINNQDDVISTSTYLGISKVARLTVHLDFAYFTNASEKRQYQIVVNGILFLLNYWKNNLKISKDTPLEEIIQDYKCKLVVDKLLDENIEKVCIKVKSPFKFTPILHNFNGIVF